MNDISHFINEGTDAAGRGDFERALDLFTRACELDPQSALAHCNRAGTLFILQRTDEAEAAYRRAVELDPSLHEAALGLIRIQASRGNWKAVYDALESMKSACTSCPPEWHYLMAMAMEHTGRELEAVETYRRAWLEGYKPAGTALVRLLLNLDRPEEALKLYFNIQPSAKSRWDFIVYVRNLYPVPSEFFALAGELFWESGQYAYAYRIRFPDIWDAADADDLNGNSPDVPS